MTFNVLIKLSIIFYSYRLIIEIIEITFLQNPLYLNIENYSIIFNIINVTKL